ISTKFRGYQPNCRYINQISRISTEQKIYQPNWRYIIGKSNISRSKLLTPFCHSDKVKEEVYAGRNWMMKPIEIERVQQQLEEFTDKDVYIHLETTNGAYASHLNKAYNVGAYIRNAKVNFSQAKIIGAGNSYRV